MGAGKTRKHWPFKFAVFGSSASDYAKEQEQLAVELARALVDSDVKILTGGGRGLPGVVAKTVHLMGGHAVAYSPKGTPEGFDGMHDSLERDYFKQVVWLEGFAVRSLKMIQDCDAAIVINGRMGTLSEYALAFEEGVHLGVLTGSGGAADVLPFLHRKLGNSMQDKKHRVNKANLFESNPRKLVKDLIDCIERRKVVEGGRLNAFCP
ncbi:MAG TPA: hypothetical protein VJA40_02155 [archaeon]|nr:hypothetical protein [archaeon]